MAETSLAQTAAARKSRLIALRARKEAHDGGASAERHFEFKQRNFDHGTRQAVAAKDREVVGDTVEKEVAGLAEGILAEDEERRKEELDLFNIQPKRPNWDLKRDMAARMGKVERKTNEAITTIFRQRLQSLRKDKGGNGGEVDLLAGISAAEHERDHPAPESDDE